MGGPPAKGRVTPYRAAYGRATEPRAKIAGLSALRVTVVAARPPTIGISGESRPARPGAGSACVGENPA
jgi:hypothetical protein